MKRIHWSFAAGVVALLVYVLLDLHMLASQLATKPLPEYLMEDYGCYARALARLRAGVDPYLDRSAGTGYLYPPQALLWVAAMEALGPLPLKFALYATTSLLGVAAMFYWVVRSTNGQASDRRRWVALVLAFAFTPVAWTMYLGQVNILVATCVAAAFFLADQEPWAAGTAIACGVALKVTPVLLLFLFVNRKYKQLQIAFVVASVVLFVLTGAAFGFEHFVTYLNVARGMSHTFPLGMGGSLSLVNTLYLLAGKFQLPTEGWYSGFELLLTLSVLGVLAYGAWLTRDGRQRHLYFALVTLGMTFSTNILWYHHLVFFLSALLLLILHEDVPRNLRYGAYALFGVLQLDYVAGAKLEKLTTTPACVVLFVCIFGELLRAARRPAFLAAPRVGSV